MWLIGAGMFFDGFNIYLAATVLGAALKSGFSTLGQNAEFVSVTFVGMTLGSFVTGFLGEIVGWHWGFGAAGFGMLIGLTVFAIRSQTTLGDIGKYPARDPNPARQRSQERRAKVVLGQVGS